MTLLSVNASFILAALCSCSALLQGYRAKDDTEVCVIPAGPFGTLLHPVKFFATNPQTAPILYTKHTGISLKASARGVLQPLVLVSIIGNVPKSIISVLRSRVRCELDAQQGCRKNQFCLSGVVSRAGIALSLSLWGLVQIQARFMLLATTPSVAAGSLCSARTHSLPLSFFHFIFIPVES